ncbi:Bestrophin, RFP-TM, chloride channel-domain-containing protein [Sporodiniella umbellata]|nr:Bestrophin, RFP-TM, chloride channel-domain-containing protein [Sporodiniella umbellata]
MVHTLINDLPSREYTRKWICRLKSYPDHLRLRGSVVPTITPLIVLIALYAYGIGVMYISWGWQKIALSNSIVPVLSVVLGLLLAFRANTSYARYYEGRQLWQDLTSNVRNLARLVWVSIPEQSESDHVEKMRCMKLLLAFAIATKHYLRREYGIDYYDLEYLLPPHWVPATAGDKTGDLRHDEALVPDHLMETNEGGDHQEDIENHSTTVTSSNASSLRQRKTSPARSQFATDEDLPDESNSDMSLPLEIIFRMSLYMQQAKTSKKIDDVFSNNIITHLNNLNDCLAGMERIVNTPIPAVYVIHLKQSLALYLLAIPFTLISELNWWIVPTIILASFTLFGIDAIGAQIENPFGYNNNDLPLNSFCDSLRKEIEFIVYHLPCETTNAMMT